MKIYKLQITFKVPDEMFEEGFDLCEDSNSHVINMVSDFIDGHPHFEGIEHEEIMTEIPSDHHERFS